VSISRFASCHGSCHGSHKNAKALGDLQPNALVFLAPLPGHISNHVPRSGASVSARARASPRLADRGVGCEGGPSPRYAALREYISKRCASPQAGFRSPQRGRDQGRLQSERPQGRPGANQPVSGKGTLPLDAHSDFWEADDCHIIRFPQARP
jgi:hypothetical protein